MMIPNGSDNNERDVMGDSLSYYSHHTKAYRLKLT